MSKEIAAKGDKIVQKKDKDKKEKKKRKSLGQYFKEVLGELKKVTWPTRKDLTSYTITVIIFVAVFAILVFGVDWVLGLLLNLIIK